MLTFSLMPVEWVELMELYNGLVLAQNKNLAKINTKIPEIKDGRCFAST